jgi:hydrogenase large subunit
MADKTIAIDPVNRIEGHQKWTCEGDYNSGSSGSLTVTDAKVHGLMFRGFEQILAQRDPRDCSIICNRI